MTAKLQLSDVTDLIEARRWDKLRNTLITCSAAEIADLFAESSSEDRTVMLRILPHALAADVFENLELKLRHPLLRALGKERLAAILNKMEPDDRAAVLEEFRPSAITGMVDPLSPEEQKTVATLLDYPEGSIARRMRQEYVMIQKNWTVGQALSHLREIGRKLESYNRLFVVGEDRSLVGIVRLRSILISSEATPVKDLLEPQIISLHATDHQERAVVIFKKHNTTILPVVDSQNKLVGVVTVDDVFDISEEEATEDIHKMGGMQALERSYLTTGLLTVVEKRAGWLVLLFVSEMLTATVMGYFEDEIAHAVVLALFIPLVISSGGNSGSQAATLVIRAMALNELRVSDWWRVMKREILSGLCLGLILGVIGFFRIACWQKLHFYDYGEHWVLIALTIFFSLIAIVLWGTLSGSMVPVILKKLRFDPATSSTPFVATMVDMTGIVIYFMVARVLLTGTLL